MSNEIQYRDPSGTTGLTIYAQRMTTTGQVWNGTSHVAFNPANWSSYAIAMTDAGGGLYLASMPAASSGVYSLSAFRQAGGSPASTDLLVGRPTPMQWDGSAEVPLSSRLPMSGYTAPDNANIAIAASQSTTAATNIGTAGAGLTAIGDTRIANLDAMVSSRSTYAGADTSGTTTLLARLTSGRAGNLDNLNATVSSRQAAGSAVTLPSPAPAGYGGAPVLHAGTAQAGTINSITLDAGAGGADEQYRYCMIALMDGTGSGQSAVINGYDGTTKVASITSSWAVIPDDTTEFQILPYGAVIVGEVGGGPRTVTQDWQGTGGFTVLNSITGQPIQGATVKAYLSSAFGTSGTMAPVIDQTTTDANGHWSLELNPAAYVLEFGYGNESSTANIIVS